MADGPNPSPDTASLVKRLAGPSTTKAGLAKDQSEINRVIAEASKGSKFYENEKRKDKDLTERITRILRLRDELVRGVDLHSLELNVDQILAKLEAQRDMTQIIVHVDMDAFYANVELLDKPDLLGKPFAVGRGVLTTASYEARKFGVRSGMPEFIARKLCPDLICMANRFSRYMEMSTIIMDIFRRYDPTMQAAGCDEGYLNITTYCLEHHLTVEECVQQMRETVCRETCLTVSAGIAPNKMLAKICSDKNKPNGQFKLDFESNAVQAFMKDLSIRKVPGVGRVNERLLDSIGIKTCGDIYTHRAVLSLMDKQFGLHFLLQTFLGIASNVVQPGERAERKSIGAERTFTPLGDENKILHKLEEVAAELESDMEHGGWTGKTVTLKYKLDTYQVFTRAKSFDRWVSTKKEDLFAIGKELLKPELPLKVRLIGLRVTKLKDLRAESEPKVGSIKRFFETLDASTSPRKRRKLGDEPLEDETSIDIDEDQQLTQDGYEDSMPGFHEHGDVEGVDFDEVEPDLSHLPEAHLPTRNRVRPPVSAPAPMINATESATFVQTSVSSKKPKSARDASPGPFRGLIERSPHDETSERVNLAVQDDIIQSQKCPICEKSLETDNKGFNAHIDFCLSKGAIKKAQAAASVQVTSRITADSKPPSRKKETATRKPRSRRGAQ